MKKSILYLFDDYHVGGVITLGRQYIQAIKPEFTTITLAFHGNMNQPKTYLDPDYYYQIPKQMRGGLHNRIYEIFLFIKYLNTIYKDHHISVIHFSTLWSATYAFFHPNTWFIKKIITFHGAHHLEHESRSYQDRPQPLTRLYKLFIHKHIQKIGLLNSSKIIVLSNYSKNLLINDFAKKLGPKIVIIPGYVNNPPSKVTYQPSKQLNIINIGRAEPRKGIDNLLRAIKILSDQKIPVTLKIASPVEYYEGSRLLFLYQKLGLFEKVHFLHSSSQNNPNLYSSADLFVIPSKMLETFGMTILESMNQGVPVVGTPIGGIVEILEQVDPHLISRDTSPEAIADAIKWFYQRSSQQKKQLSDKGLEIVKTTYSKKQIARQIKDLYRSIS